MNAAGTVTTYTYDVRNRMASFTVTGISYLTYYVYDDAGNRVADTSINSTNTYLIDTDNPTGYSQPIEMWTGSTLTASYILGTRVMGTASGAGASNVSFYLVDGHENVRTALSSSGAVQQINVYDAYGDIIYTANNGTGPILIFSFAGDAVYDYHSKLFLHGDGIRDSRPGCVTLSAGQL